MVEDGLRHVLKQGKSCANFSIEFAHSAGESVPIPSDVSQWSSLASLEPRADVPGPGKLLSRAYPENGPGGWLLAGPKI
jgi:hypothetical protein